MVEEVAELLAAAPEGRVRRVCTPLCQRTRREGRGGASGLSAPRGRETPCSTMGGVRGTGGARRLPVLPDLSGARQDETQKAFVEAGVATRRKALREGRDPSQSPSAVLKLRAAMVERNRERREWDTDHGPHPDPAEFVDQILPGLQATPVRRLMAATGLSKSYCAEGPAGEAFTSSTSLGGTPIGNSLLGALETRSIKRTGRRSMSHTE